MEIRHKKDMSRSYTQFLGDNVQMEDYPIRMVLNHLPNGLIHSSVSILDEKQVWNCEHTGKQSLSEYCEKNSLGSEQVRWIYGEILDNLKEIQEYLLDVSHLYLEPEEIYLDNTNHKVWNCYVPFYEKDIWMSLCDLTQYLLGCLDQKETQAVHMAYGLFRYFSKGDCNIEKAWEILYEEKDVFVNDKIEEKCERSLDTSDFLNDTGKEKEDREEKSRFPIEGWLLMGLSWAGAVFLLAYIAFNEWYLTNTGKILLLVLVMVLGFVGTMAWRRWRPKIKKKNPMEEMPRLIRADTKDEIVVPQNPSIIGKKPDMVQVQILEPAVSRIHGRITYNNGDYYLEDLNSKNGTYVNGVRLEKEKPVRLKDEDVLVFANIRYYFRL